MPTGSSGDAQDETLFGDVVVRTDAKPMHDRVVRQRVLITVKAAPNPSQNHGETVCVAGIRLDEIGHREWIRLYPINFRDLLADSRFKKYDVVTVDCRPARQDARLESWKPAMGTLQVDSSVKGWVRRREWIDPLIQDDMCGVRRAAEANMRAPSLALIKPREITDFVVTEHPGWSRSEEAKIDAYVNQLDLFDSRDKTPLEAPRFRGSYHWKCGNLTCRGHEQGVIDWEFVALQRSLHEYSDAALKVALRAKFLDELCAPERDVSFYVGNQAKRVHVFSVLGVYWPRHTD